MEQKITKKMYSRVLLLAGIAFYFFAPQMSIGQTSSIASFQTQTAEQILTDLALRCKVSPARDKVLVAGQIKTSAHLFHQSTLSLTRAIAVLGGLTADGHSAVLLLRLSGDRGNRSITEIDLRQIKSGEIGDFMLKGGDVVFVPRSDRAVITLDSPGQIICPKVAREPWQLIDAPIVPPMRRNPHTARQQTSILIKG